MAYSVRFVAHWCQKHHWTYPRGEFVALGVHCETGETDLFFFGFFWWPFFLGGLLFVALDTGVYTLGFAGGIGSGERDEPRVKLAWHGVSRQAVQC